MAWQWYYVRIMNDLDRRMPIIEQLLPYVQLLDVRALPEIDLAVIHCTELPDLATARQYGERVLYGTGTGNSGHYYLDRDGGIYRYVPHDRIANHTRGYNPRSIGIEIVNTGRFPDWLDSRHQAMAEAYTEQQIEQLSALLISLKQQLPNLRFIAGHEALDTDQVPASDNPDVLVYRKRDPGPQFPWAQVLSSTHLTPLTP